VTLDDDNILWLRARAGAARLRSVSELLNQIVSTARRSKSAPHPKSVVGTLRIAPDDAALETADAAVRQLFDAALTGASIAPERPARYGRTTRPSNSRKKRA